MMASSRSWMVAAFAVIASVLVATAPAAAASSTATISTHTNATELSSGTLSNSEVERSGDPAVVGHDLARSSAVARWAFDYGSGSTAYDHVGSNDGSISGATWTAGKSGEALDFDVGDSVDTSASVGSGDFTVSLWFQTDRLTDTDYIISEWGSDGQRAFYLRIVGGSDEIQFAVKQSDHADSRVIIPESEVSTNTWHHVTMVADSSAGDLAVYLDGGLQDTASWDGSFDGSSSINMGRLGTDSPDFDGTLEEVRVYDSALTPGQARRLADSPPAKLSATATERWALDNGSGTTAFGDEGTDGVVNGDPAWVSAKSGDGLDLDGSGDYVNTTTSEFDGIDKVSVSAWIKPGIAPGVWTSDRGFVGNHFSEAWEITMGKSGSWYFQVSASSGKDLVNGGTWSKGAWTHVVGVYDGSEIRLYVNGTEVASTAHTGAINSTANDVFVGLRPGSANYVNGTVDDVRIFKNIALDDADVQYLFDHPGAQLNETSRYNATHSVTNSVEGWTDLELHNATATVEWQTAGGSTLSTATYTTSGNKTQTWSSSSADTVTANVTVEATHPDHYARLEDDGVRATVYDPEVDNASASPDSKTDTVDSTPVDLSIDVSDRDFPTSQGDSVTVEFFVDGSSIGTDTLASNGTATVTWSDPTAGTHTWHVELNDSYGGTSSSATFDVAVPSQIQIREEESPHDLIKDATGVEVRTFGSNETLDQRTVTDGNISLLGLPADETYVFVVNASGYHRRSILITDLFDQTSIFLLDKNKTGLSTTLDVTDLSGDFTPGDGIELRIQKSINRSVYGGTGGFQWTTLAGDKLGADGTFTVVLEKGTRYRILLENQNGQTRTLDHYTATSEGTKSLTITEDDRIQLSSGGVQVSFHPDVGVITGNQTVNVSATISSEEGNLSSYDLTAIYDDGSTTTTLASTTGSSSTGETLEFSSLDLTNRAGGTLTLKVNYTTADGSTGVSQTTYLVSEADLAGNSLFAVLTGFTDGLPADSRGSFEALLATAITVIGTGAIAKSLRLGTELVGLVVVAFVATFAILGWFAWSTFFATGVVWMAITAAMRGL